MSKQINIGVGGINRKSKPFIGVGGAAKKVKAVFIGIGGQVIKIWTGQLTKVAIIAKDINTYAPDRLTPHLNGPGSPILYMARQVSNNYAICGLNETFQELWSRQYNYANNVGYRMMTVKPEGQENCFGCWEDRYVIDDPLSKGDSYSLACWNRNGQELWRKRTDLNLYGNLYPMGVQQIFAFENRIYIHATYYIPAQDCYEEHYQIFDLLGNKIGTIIAPPEAARQFTVKYYAIYNGRLTSNNYTYSITSDDTAKRVTIRKIDYALNTIWERTLTDFAYSIDWFGRVIIPYDDDTTVYFTKRVKDNRYADFYQVLLKVNATTGELIKRYNFTKMAYAINADADGSLYLYTETAFEKWDKNQVQIWAFTGFEDFATKYWAMTDVANSYVYKDLIYFPYKATSDKNIYHKLQQS